MSNDDKNAKYKMTKRVETKEDGRLIIFYTFESSPDQNEPENDARKEALKNKGTNKAD